MRLFPGLLVIGAILLVLGIPLDVLTAPLTVILVLFAAYALLFSQRKLLPPIWTTIALLVALPWMLRLFVGSVSTTVSRVTGELPTMSSGLLKLSPLGIVLLLVLVIGTVMARRWIRDRNRSARDRYEEILERRVRGRSRRRVLPGEDWQGWEDGADPVFTPRSVRGHPRGAPHRNGRP